MHAAVFVLMVVARTSPSIGPVSALLLRLLLLRGVLRRETKKRERIPRALELRSSSQAHNAESFMKHSSEIWPICHAPGSEQLFDDAVRRYI